MNDILDHESEDISEYNGNLFVRVLTNPRPTFRYLHEHTYDKHVWKLLIFSGIVSSIYAFFYTIFFSDRIFQNMFIAGFSTLIFNYISAALLSRFGNLSKGTQKTEAMLRVVAYSMVPVFFSIIFPFLYRLVLFFTPVVVHYSGFCGLAMPDTDRVEWIYQLLAVGNILITIIWPLVLMTIGISEIQNFPIWKAFLNVFATFILIGLLITIIMVLFF